MTSDLGSAPPSPTNDERRRASGEVTLDLRTETPTERAQLRDATGATICRLPCVARIPRESNFTIELRKETGGVSIIDVPSEIEGVGPSGRGIGIAAPKHGHPGAGLALGVTGGVVGALGIAMVAGSCGQQSTGRSFEALDFTPVLCAIGAFLAIAGGGLGLSGLVLGVESSRPALQVSPAP
jgi:hypothetical protein